MNTEPMSVNTEPMPAHESPAFVPVPPPPPPTRPRHNVVVFLAVLS